MNALLTKIAADKTFGDKGVTIANIVDFVLRHPDHQTAYYLVDGGNAIAAAINANETYKAILRAALADHHYDLVAIGGGAYSITINTRPLSH